MAASKFYQVVHPRPISLFQSLFKNGLSLVQGSSSFSYQNFHFDPFWGIQISHFQPHPLCCSCAYLRHQLRRLRQLRRQYHSIEVPPVVAQAQLPGSDFSHWRAQMNGQAFLEAIIESSSIPCHGKIQTQEVKLNPVGDHPSRTG